MSGLLNADDLVLCNKLEENLRAMVVHFVEVCRRIGLKVNAGKSKVMVLGGKEEELECEFCMDRMKLEYVLEFKYLGCVLDESGIDEAECHRKVANGRRVAYATRSMVNARDLQLEYASVLHESLLMPVLMYGSEAMIWKENERYRIRAVKMDNLRGLQGIRRMDKVPNA